MGGGADVNALGDRNRRALQPSDWMRKKMLQQQMKQTDMAMSRSSSKRSSRQSRFDEFDELLRCRVG